jgi:PAS domain S-box-containing protein
MADELVDRAPVGFGEHDVEGRWVRVNPALAAINRTTPEELIGRRPSEVHGELGRASEAIMRRVLASGRTERTVLEGELGTEPGRPRQFEVAYFPLAEGVGVVAIEVTDRRVAEIALAEAHRRDAILARAGQLLGTALSVQETADLVARLVVPEMADWCFVELVRDDGRVERVALAHRDPEKERWARELSERYAVNPDAAYGSAEVMRTGEPILMPDIPPALLEQAVTDDEHRRVLNAVGFRSACIVPLIARGRTLGTIALTMADSERRFSPEILPLARSLAELFALALDNALLYAQRDLVAVTLQEQLLPSELPTIPGLDVAARYSAAGEGNDVGGDFYDVFSVGNAWMAVIGDVVGKGPAAAAITGLARHTLRAAAQYETSPSALLKVLNRALLSEQDGLRLASVAAVRIEPGEDGTMSVCVAAAGHPLPIRVSADGVVRDLGVHGQLLGVHEDPLLSDTVADLGAGDLLVLYTDGVIEVRGPAGIFGEERLRALLAESAADAPSRVVTRVEQAVLAASGGRPRDDVAVVALRPRPVPRA